MKTVILCAVAVIVFIGSVAYAFNNGYDTGFNIATEEAKDDYNNLLRNNKILNDEWKKEYTEMVEVNKTNREAYERQIKVLKQMLEKERGEKNDD